MEHGEIGFPLVGYELTRLSHRRGQPNIYRRARTHAIVRSDGGAMEALNEICSIPREQHRISDCSNVRLSCFQEYEPDSKFPRQPCDKGADTCLTWKAGRSTLGLHASIHVKHVSTFNGHECHVCSRDYKDDVKNIRIDVSRPRNMGASDYSHQLYIYVALFLSLHREHRAATAKAATFTDIMVSPVTEAFHS